MKPVNLNYLLIKQSINEHLLRFLMRSQRIKQKVKMLVSFYIKNQAKNLKKQGDSLPSAIEKSKKNQFSIYLMTYIQKTKKIRLYRIY